MGQRNCAARHRVFGENRKGRKQSRFRHSCSRGKAPSPESSERKRAHGEGSALLRYVRRALVRGKNNCDGGGRGFFCERDKFSGRVRKKNLFHCAGPCDYGRTREPWQNAL